MSRNDSRAEALRLAVMASPHAGQSKTPWFVDVLIALVFLALLTVCGIGLVVRHA